MDNSYYKPGDKQEVERLIGEYFPDISDLGGVDFLNDLIDHCSSSKELDARLGTEIMFNEAKSSRGGSSGPAVDIDAFGYWPLGMRILEGD